MKRFVATTLAALAAAVALVVVPSSPAHAFDVGSSVEGANARRSVTLIADNGHILVHGWVRDTTGNNYRVWIRVRLEVNTSQGWRTVDVTDTYSANGYRDANTNPTADCLPGRQYRASAWWQWRNANDQGIVDYVSGPMVWVPEC